MNQSDNCLSEKPKGKHRSTLTAREEMSAKWPDYDFSTYVYNGAYELGTFICPVHGEVQNYYKDIMRSKKTPCKLCVKMTTETVLKELKELYGESVFNRYDWSKAEYTKAEDGLSIECPDHGVVTPAPTYNSLSTRRSRTPCNKCNIAARSETQYDTLETFLEKAAKYGVLKPTDDFSEAVYVGSKIQMKIRCTKEGHGVYLRRPNDYQQGQSCPKCSDNKISKSEVEVREFLESLGVKTWGPLSMRSGKHADIWVPHHNLLIEYNGLLYHSDSEKYGRKDSQYHCEKTASCEASGMRMIHIFEDEWLAKRSIVEARLKSVVGFSERIYARTTTVEYLNASEASEFLQTHHIQGSARGAGVYLGLRKGCELVAVMSFGQIRFGRDTGPGRYELFRYCSNGTVIGGFSKLLKRFIKDYDPVYIESYSDRRWSQGNVYAKNGFVFDHRTQPNYFWAKNQQRFNRMSFQKHKLKDKFPDLYADEKTEDQICREAGYYKVYDCGNDKWVMDFSKAQ